MDIHAPDKPIHTFKEFGIHIAVVTIGILIALSLEGIRESIHDHRLIRETRDNFQAELRGDQNYAHRELQRVQEINQQLNALLADLPTLVLEHPDQIQPRLQAINNPVYFLTAEGWQSALSTGALAHLSTDEVSKYANVYYIIREYVQFQDEGIGPEDRAKAFFLSHPHLVASDLPEATERLLLFQRSEHHMESICKQMSEQIDQVLSPDSR